MHLQLLPAQYQHSMSDRGCTLHVVEQWLGKRGRLDVSNFGRTADHRSSKHPCVLVPSS